MRPTAIALAAVLVSQAANGAHAADERYQLEKSDHGYIRMDTKTGAMSICEEQGGQLVCKLAADERDAYQEQIEHLENAVKALEKRVTALERNLPAVQVPALPSEEEFEKGMNYMERFFRRFMGIVKDLEKDENKPEGTPQQQSPGQQTPLMPNKA